MRTLVLTTITIWFLSAGLFAQAERRVAVTFDDLPASRNVADLPAVRETNIRLLNKLRTAGVPATGFVNESKLYFAGEVDDRIAILDSWLAAGHDLGNHTFSHIAIDNARFEQYCDDVIRGETVSRMLLSEHGKKLRYFRHTQLRTGPTDEYREKLNRFLEQRGYTIAPVTIDNDEYIFAAVYDAALAKGDETLKREIATAYVRYMDQVFEHFENLGEDFLKRKLAQVLLLHVNRLNADHFDKLVEMMDRRGYRFITLDEALRDRAYSLPEVTSRRGLSWINRWMLAKGLAPGDQPPVPNWISELFRASQR